MKREFSGQIFDNYSNAKFHGNSSSGSRVIPCERTDGRTDRQTDMTKLRVAFSNFENTPKNPFLPGEQTSVWFEFVPNHRLLGELQNT
jgi:hypothetical protein